MQNNSDSSNNYCNVKHAYLVYNNLAVHIVCSIACNNQFTCNHVMKVYYCYNELSLLGKAVSCDNNNNIVNSECACLQIQHNFKEV